MKRGEHGGFLGSVQDFTVYRRKDVKQDILKLKGGPTKDQILHKPSFAVTRKNISEFGGRSKLAARVNKIIRPIKPVLDHNINNAVNAMVKPIQELDQVSVLGKRHVQLTKKPGLLEGHQLNHRNPFESIISNHVLVDVSKPTLEATITLPDLLPGINFHGIGTFQFYRVVAVLGLVPDIFYHNSGYAPDADYDQAFPASYIGSWQQVNSYATAGTIHLQLPYASPSDSCSLVVAMGISFGLNRNGNIEPVKGAGAGKLLRVV